MVEIDPRLAHEVVDIFASCARLGALLGHPMLCLVSTTADLGDVGGMRVHSATPLTGEPDAGDRAGAQVEGGPSHAPLA